MTLRSIGFSSIFLGLIVGCDPGNKCVADCDDSVGSGSGSGGSESDGGTPLVCEDAKQAADAFLSANQACESSLDCGVLNAFCYQGSQTSCGEVAINRDADLQAWVDAYTTLEGCESECGANPCGNAGPFCNDEGRCDVTIDSASVCEQVTTEYAEFLNANRACQTTDDCVYVESNCYTGPERACVAVSMNVDADVAHLQELDDLLQSCGAECGGSECGAHPECLDGLCTAVFP